MRFFVVCMALMMCVNSAFAVHDRELDNVYRDKLVIPPELRTAPTEDESGEVEEAIGAQPTPAEEDFLSMFDVG